MSILYLEDLNEIFNNCNCGIPGCTHKPEFIHARCHIDSGLDVKVLKNSLELSCRECKKLVCEIAIASKTGVDEC